VFVEIRLRNRNVLIFCSVTSFMVIYVPQVLFFCGMLCTVDTK